MLYFSNGRPRLHCLILPQPWLQQLRRQQPQMEEEDPPVATELVIQGKIATTVQLTVLAVPRQDQSVLMAYARLQMARTVPRALKIVTESRMATRAGSSVVVMALQVV